MWKPKRKPALYFSIALPLLALAGEAGFILHNVATQLTPAPARNHAVRPETVRLEGIRFAYRPAGEYLQNGKPVDPGLETSVFFGGLEVTANLISVGDYQKCVHASACEPAGIPANMPANIPITGVSYTDANAYAHWLSRQTGQTWRLPTDREWTFAAGSRAVDDAIGETDPGDPSVGPLAGGIPQNKYCRSQCRTRATTYWQLRC